MAPNVQQDLKLTDAQVKRIQETLREIRESHQGEYAALRDPRRMCGRRKWPR